jgi:hypothetical protein
MGQYRALLRSGNDISVFLSFGRYSTLYQVAYYSLIGLPLISLRRA